MPPLEDVPPPEEDPPPDEEPLSEDVLPPGEVLPPGVALSPEGALLLDVSVFALSEPHANKAVAIASTKRAQSIRVSFFIFSPFICLFC